MKTTFIILLLSIVICIPTYADNNDYQVDLTEYGSETDSGSDSDIDHDPDPERRKSRSLHIQCSISKESGIIFYGFDSDNIESFEICDADDQPIAIFLDEHDFVEYLLSLNGVYFIKFYVNNRVLAGWICV